MNILARRFLALAALVAAHSFQSVRAETIAVDGNQFGPNGNDGPITYLTVSGNQAGFQGFASGSGSGVYTALFRVQNNGTSMGYNYDYDNGADNSPRFDQKNGVGTLDLDMGSIPIVTIGGQIYAQFLLDVNENDNAIALTEFRLYLQADGVAGNAVDTVVSSEANLGNLGTVIYDLDFDYVNNVAVDNTVNITQGPSGSGSSDVAIYIPIDRFAGQSNLSNIYLWTKFTGGSSGFEEWAILAGAPTTISSLPEPGTGIGALAMLGLAGSTRLRRRTAHTA